MADLSERPWDPFEREIATAAERASWAELVERARVRGAPRSAEQERASTRYVEHAEARAARMLGQLLASGAQIDTAGALFGRVVVDVGVGFGGSLAALTARFPEVLCVEVDRTRALLAQLRAHELGVADRVTVMCTDGPTIPLESGSASVVVALNVIEHLVDAVGPVLDEIARVLVPGGIFVADSRNRYDVLFPEPHVRLRGVGFLPRAWQGAYARARGVRRIPPTRLLSMAELERLLTARFHAVQIGLARPSGFGHDVRWDALVAAIEDTPWVREVVARVYPSHVVAARR